MNTSRIFAAAAALLVSGETAVAAAAKVDILPPARRQASVEKAQRITQPPAPKQVPEDLPQPFNPPDFNQPDPSERPAPDGPAQTASHGDREILELLAARLTPSGTFIFNEKPLLVISGKRFEVGTRFTVAYDGRDYELELTAIDRTTFTLRYRGEEVTRPIAIRK